MSRVQLHILARLAKNDMATLRSPETVAACNRGLLERYQACAEYLIQKCKQLGHILGAQKLERQCLAEQKYLKSLARRRGGFDISHLRSSNLSHYIGVVHAAQHLPNVTQILQAFSCPGRAEALHVDVVAGQGHLWVKVIARKAQALHLIWAGQGQFGERDILVQARDYVMCTKEHPVNFVEPQVVFAFYNGITEAMVSAFLESDILVLGERVPVSDDVQRKLSVVTLDDSDTDDDTDTANVSSAPSGQSPDAHKYAVSHWPSTKEKKHDFTNSGDQNVPLLDKTNFNEIVAENQSLVLENVGKSIIGDFKAKSLESNISQCKLPTDSGVSYRNDIATSPVSTQTKPVMSDSENTNNTQLPSRNQGLLCTGNISDRVCSTAEQFHGEIDLANGAKETDNVSSDGCDAVSATVRSFIQEELLLFPVVAFHELEHVLQGKRANTIENIPRVNLDITCLITLVSAVAHGGCYFHFKEKILCEQAAEERLDPVLPKLNAFLEDKELFTCETAVSSFRTILDTLGGDKEKLRADALMERITVVPDHMSFRAETLPNTGKIKDRSKVIFGTGDSLRAVTVTANAGFVRAAEHQGVLFAVFLHASRALTETKEGGAEEI